MEVHSHSHSHGKKNWKSYFWEFLMLFLAVFAGFLAENKREHVVEHQREKAYAGNMYEELKRDTARLRTIIESQKKVSARLDTLCLLMRKRDKDSITVGMLYNYGSDVTLVNYFASFNTTVEQLKGSGNLRIMGHELSHQISDYDRLIRQLENEYGLSKSEFLKLEDLHFRIFDVYLMETMLSSGRISSRDSVNRLRELPINMDPGLIREYVGWVKFEAGIYDFQSRDYLEPLLKSAELLLKTLKEKYKLE